MKTNSKADYRRHKQRKHWKIKKKPKNIIITNLDSQDNTLKIINNLEKEYKFIKILSWKDCKQLIENIKEN